jgi:subtilisin family serine protease
MAEKLEPELDGAVKDIRADLVHKGEGLPQPYTGKNVIIGIVDWGFDYTHPTFYDTTLSHSRIIAAWDQEKVIGTPLRALIMELLISLPKNLPLHSMIHSPSFMIIMAHT